MKKLLIFMAILSVTACKKSDVKPTVPTAPATPTVVPTVTVVTTPTVTTTTPSLHLLDTIKLSLKIDSSIVEIDTLARIVYPLDSADYVKFSNTNPYGILTVATDRTDYYYLLLSMPTMQKNGADFNQSLNSTAAPAQLILNQFDLLYGTSRIWLRIYTNSSDVKGQIINVYLIFDADYTIEHKGTAASSTSTVTIPK